MFSTMTSLLMIRTRLYNSCDVYNCVKVNVRAGLYHGWDNLCTIVGSTDKIVTKGIAALNENWSFELTLQNVPRMARLCLLVYTTPDKRGEKTTSKSMTVGGRKNWHGKRVNGCQLSGYNFE